MNNPIISIENLNKTFYTGNQALSILNDLSMQVEDQKKVIIVGSSGSGKSTLLNIIAGLDTATKGNIIVGNYNITKLTENELTEYRTHFLGLIFQFHYLLKDFTALENVYLPAFMGGLSKKTAIEKAEKLLDDVGLLKRKDHLPSELSGGERQRVAVARALINDPKLILADEPTGNLDPENAKSVSELLFSMVEKYNKTLILVTHDQSLTNRADIVYSIKDFKLFQENER